MLKVAIRIGCLLANALINPAFAAETGRVDLVSTHADGTQWQETFSGSLALGAPLAYLRTQELGDHASVLKNLVTGVAAPYPLDPALPITLAGDGTPFTSTMIPLSLADTNQKIDIYRLEPEIELVSVGDMGQIGDNHSNSWRTDQTGTRVLFRSFATNLITGVTVSSSQYYLRDLIDHTTTRVSSSANGCLDTPSSATLDATGRFVGLVSSNKKEVRLWNSQTQSCTTIIPSAAIPYLISSVNIAREGRYILVSGGTTRGEALWIDTHTGERKDPCLNVQAESSDCTGASLSPDGRYVGFQSSQPDFVAEDTNAASDVFVRDMRRDETVLASRPFSGSQQPGKAVVGRTGWNLDNTFIFLSSANNLAPGDVGNGVDAFRWFPDSIGQLDFDAEE